VIATFPNFTKLELEDKETVRAITARFEPYADFSFVNLLAWGQDEAAELSLLHGNVVVRLPDYYTGETTMYTLIGEHKIDQTVADLLTITDRIQLVPEVVVERLMTPHAFAITEDRDNDDYVYHVPTLATLSGGDYKKKRNKVHAFTDFMGDAVHTEVLTQLDTTQVRELQNVFQQWMLGNNKTEAESSSERIALDNLLANKPHEDLRFTIVRIHGEVCAFSIHEISVHSYAICHFEKALPVHPGLYSYIIQQATRDLEAQGVQWVNWQQDLGMPGLRKAKMSYRPAKFLKKYTIAAL